MAEIIKMPRLSDTMEEGNIVGWNKKVGDKVSAGDVLAEVETDKATMDLESFHDGVLLYVAKESGIIPVDGVIAVIGEKDEDFSAQLKATEAEASSATNAETEAPVAHVQSTAPVVESEPKAHVVQATSSSDDRVKASPLAKAIASENNIDIKNVPGTGDGGRVIKVDIEQYIVNGGTSAPASASTPMIGLNTDVRYGDQPISQMRKVIAKRLGESKFTAPHFYLTIEIDMDNAISAREDLKAAGIRASYNDIVIKACAAALKKHPMVNASWLGDKIRVNQEINIGVAVAIDEGLLVPVINNADQKTLSYINHEVRDLAGKARERKLQPDQMSGNTFTISNLGSFDIQEFTAIINPPDACILAVGAIVEKPVVKNGAIVVGNTMKVTMSCDHRVVDGAKGAEFLKDLKANLENPLRMLA